MDQTAPTFLLTLLDGEDPHRNAEMDVPERGAAIAGRYVVRSRLGSGGFGEVWVARDRVRGEDVAVKLVGGEHDQERRRARREVNALRWLRLPGVVRMHDEGRWNGAWFIVMDLIDGRNFPGTERRHTWDELRRPATRLLEILAGVHRAGVVHRDLKPGNVMVREGEPVVLDFGLARGKALTSAEVRSAEGTPRYAAPEQLLRRPTDDRCDLYAVGVMLYEALSGCFPHGAPGHVSQLVQSRLLDTAPPLCTVAPEVPDEVGALVDKLLSRERDDRPSSALEALEALGGTVDELAPELGARLPSERVEADRLWELFAGPDHFLHLREDGSRQLWDRTAGEPRRVREELAAWVRGGVARQDGELVALDRAAIGRLETGLRLVTRRFQPGEGSLGQDALELSRWIRLAWPDGHEETLRSVFGRGFDQALGELLDRDLAWYLEDGRLAAGAPLEGPTGWSRARSRDAHALLAARLPEGSEGRLRQLLAADARAVDLAAQANLVVATLHRAGQLERAGTALDLALAFAREAQDVVLEEELLQRRAEMARGVRAGRRDRGPALRGGAERPAGRGAGAPGAAGAGGAGGARGRGGAGAGVVGGHRRARSPARAAAARGTVHGRRVPVPRGTAERAGEHERLGRGEREEPGELEGLDGHAPQPVGALRRSGGAARGRGAGEGRRGWEAGFDAQRRDGADGRTSARGGVAARAGGAPASAELSTRELRSHGDLDPALMPLPRRGRTPG